MSEIPRRNVHVFSSSGVEVAGFFQHGGVSVSTFVRWINDVCYIPVEWTPYPCQFDNNRAIGGSALDLISDDDIQPGRYVIRKPWTTKFVNRVRARDARCCIKGDLVAGEDYTGFEVAHIFPLSQTDIWNDLNYKRFIEDDEIEAGFELNSVQQGFLCSAAEHRMFDDYSIGVNPDENYCIYDFVGRDPNRSPHRRTFYRNSNEPQMYLPSADLLRDHFRQCLLRHVKGAGKSDERQRHFDPDIDLRREGFNLSTNSWWSGCEGKKQLEAELAARLWAPETP